jgi:hypothetical protein
MANARVANKRVTEKRQTPRLRAVIYEERRKGRR